MFEAGSPPEKITEKTIFSFFINLVLVVLGFVSAVYLGIFLNNRQTIDQELLSRGRSIAETIVYARNWSARHGGVWVRKTPTTTSSPFLKNPDITSLDGTIYTKKNPALMVREISEIIGKEGAFQFHIASRKPLNPVNVPDAFEEQALVTFEQGTREAYLKESREDGTYFRYMAPLIVEESCLECHEDQDYRVGDIRGGLSVRFNIDAVESAQQRNLYAMTGLALASFFSLAAIIYRLVHRLRRRLVDAEMKLQQLAITDELTGLRNRRYLMQRLRAELKQMRRDFRPLSCILFDLDHFKRINDTFGHAAGDRVLQAVAATTRNLCRENDILGRYGGEEFMAVLPGTPPEGAMEIAERWRQTLMNTPVFLPDGEEVRVTASFGVAWIHELTVEPDGDEMALLKRTDDALYQAKAAGRNRVASGG